MFHGLRIGYEVNTQGGTRTEPTQIHGTDVSLKTLVIEKATEDRLRDRHLDYILHSR